MNSDLVSSRTSLGFVQIVMGQDQDGREFLRLEWSSARRRREMMRQEVEALPGTEGRPRLCSECIWLRAAEHWSSKGIDGRTIIHSPTAWEYAKCVHPEARISPKHLVAEGAEPDGRYATSIRATHGPCGEEGSLFEPAATRWWRAPRSVAPWVAASTPTAVVLMAIAALPNGAILLFCLPFSAMLGYSLWALVRRL